MHAVHIVHIVVRAEANQSVVCFGVLFLHKMRVVGADYLHTMFVCSDIPEALANTQEIADKVEIYDIDHGPIMPLFDIPKDFGTEDEIRQKYTEEGLWHEFMTDEHGQNPLSEKDAQKRFKNLGGYDRMYRIKFEAEYLSFLTWNGAKKRYPELELFLENTKGLDYHYWDAAALDERQREVVNRILFELHVMKTMGFPGYFLIVMDFIRGARQVIADKRPQIRMACYHRSEDIFALPVSILALRDDYRIFLRHKSGVPSWNTEYFFV